LVTRIWLSMLCNTLETATSAPSPVYVATSWSSNNRCHWQHEFLYFSFTKSVGLPLFADCFETKAFENVITLYHLFGEGWEKPMFTNRQHAMRYWKSVKNSYFKCEKFDFQDWIFRPKAIITFFTLFSQHKITRIFHVSPRVLRGNKNWI